MKIRNNFWRIIILVLISLAMLVGMTSCVDETPNQNQSQSQNQNQNQNQNQQEDTSENLETTNTVEKYCSLSNTPEGNVVFPEKDREEARFRGLFTYNSDNSLIKCTLYTIETEVIEREYWFNENEDFVKAIVYIDGVEAITEREYNGDRTVSKSLNYENGKLYQYTEYKYESDGSKEQTQYSADGTIKHFYKFDAEGNNVIRKEYDGEGKINYESNSEQEPEVSISYTYGEDGSLESYKKTIYGEEYAKTIYTYEADDFLTKEVFINKNGQIYEEKEYYRDGTYYHAKNGEAGWYDADGNRIYKDREE